MSSPEQHLADLSVSEIVRRTTAGEVTAVAVTQACLDRIAERDGPLNAFSVVLAEEALAEAARRDADTGPRGALHGVPVAIKEEIDVAGCVTTFGGRGNSTPVAADSEVVRRLRAAGAVIIGKTRMPEFGIWPFTESQSGGITRNPWDTDRTPAGSSGGTAVAVAAGMVPVGLGGDGGGSIRLPSAHCGLFGLKPERGRVTSSPMPHLWWGLGTTGPLARSVLDSALVYDAIRGPAEGDLFAAGEPATGFAEAARTAPGRLRIGWSATSPTKGLRPHAEHVAALRDTARLLGDLGHEVREVEPGYPDTTLAFLPQFLAGIRTECGLVEHPERLEHRTRALNRIAAGVPRRALDSALRAGERLSQRANRVFDDVDVLLTPMTLDRPRKAGVLDRGHVPSASATAIPAIAYAAIWNVTGNPAASVPAGLAQDGLPLAVQLVGRHDDEPTLLGLSAQLEAARPWTMPPMGG